MKLQGMTISEVMRVAGKGLRMGDPDSPEAADHCDALAGMIGAWETSHSISGAVAVPILLAATAILRSQDTDKQLELQVQCARVLQNILDGLWLKLCAEVPLGECEEEEGSDRANN